MDGPPRPTRRWTASLSLIVPPRPRPQAEADAGPRRSEGESERVGAAVATGIEEGSRRTRTATTRWIQRGPDRVNPFSIPAIIPNMGAAWVSMELGTKGPLTSQCTACAASNMSIGEGMDAIRLGRADVMLCGGTEAPVTRDRHRRLQCDEGSLAAESAPEKASRPFDAGRDGFVMGEAARSSYSSRSSMRRARGAKYLRGDARLRHLLGRDHITEPDPTGHNPARAMQIALKDGGVTVGRAVTSTRTAPSTPLGDASETRVIKLAIGDDPAREIPISSTKGATGHTLGASGAVEAIFTTLAVQRGCRRRPSTTRSPTPSAISTTSPTRRAEVKDLAPGCPTPSGSAVTTRRSSWVSGRNEPRGNPSFPVPPPCHRVRRCHWSTSR